MTQSKNRAIRHQPIVSCITLRGIRSVNILLRLPAYPLRKRRDMNVQTLINFNVCRTRRFVFELNSVDCLSALVIVNVSRWNRIRDLYINREWEKEIWARFHVWIELILTSVQRNSSRHSMKHALATLVYILCLSSGNQNRRERRERKICITFTRIDKMPSGGGKGYTDAVDRLACVYAC